MIPCPKCGADIDVDEEELDEGERLICEECAVHLVVVGVDPLDLEVDAEDAEDDDEDLDELEDEDEEEEEDEDEDWR
jgi:alpha-aminoadipate/glutamate carrier protein LysW